MKPLYYKIYLLLLFTISGNYQLQAQSWLYAHLYFKAAAREG